MKKIIGGLVMAVGVATSGSALANERFEGLTVGVQLGLVQADNKHSDPDGKPQGCWYWCNNDVIKTDVAPSFGLNADYNFVSGALLYGARAELVVTSVDTYTEMTPSDPSYKMGTETSLYGSLAGKIGVASGNLAVFALAGLALADSKQRYDETDGSVQYFRRDGESTGLFFGVGTEYALSDSGSIGFDVGVYRFAKSTPMLLTTGDVQEGRYFPQRDQLIDAKLSYKFKF